MNGKGRVIDNIFVKRLWRTVKYEDIYFKAYLNGCQLEVELQACFKFYNCCRFHQTLAHRTPGVVLVRPSREWKQQREPNGRQTCGITYPI
jgi:putative transposase